MSYYDDDIFSSKITAQLLLVYLIVGPTGCIVQVLTWPIGSAGTGTRLGSMRKNNRVFSTHTYVIVTGIPR